MDKALTRRTEHEQADGAWIRFYWRKGKRGGGARDLKGACTSLPIFVSCARTTCLTIERVRKVLGSVVGSILGTEFTLLCPDHWPHCSASVQGAWECSRIHFVLQEIKYLQFKCSTIVKCIQELF